MFSFTLVRKATTSWLVVFSISSVRSTLNAALASISARSSAGMTPRRAHARHTASSTSSQRCSLASSVQMAAISGREYLGIMRPIG